MEQRTDMADYAESNRNFVLRFLRKNRFHNINCFMSDLALFLEQHNVRTICPVVVV